MEGIRISWVELFRNDLMGRAGESPEKVRKCELNDTQKNILDLLSENPRLSAAKLGRQLKISNRSVEKNIKKLKEYGMLIRHGSPKSGYWQVVGNKAENDKDMK